MKEMKESIAVPPFTPHEMCEAATEYVLRNVNTIQYILQAIEEITGAPFTRDRIKCLSARGGERGGEPPAATETAPHQQDEAGSAMAMHSAAAGYMWRRARPDCNKGDIVLVQERLAGFVNAKQQQTHQEELAKALQGDLEAERARTNAASSIVSESSHADGSNPNKRPNSDKSKVSGGRPQRTHELEAAERRKALDAFIATQTAALHETERNLRHELIHAFDDTRGVVEGADCLHQACSEIRAARLSGDCLQGQLLRKGRMDLLTGGLRCVERRATLAVEMNPVCKGFSQRAVQTMMAQCYTDYEPFAAPLFFLGSYGDETFANSTIGNVSKAP